MDLSTSVGADFSSPCLSVVDKEEEGVKASETVDENITYYSVAVPLELCTGIPLIFTTKEEAISTLKKFPESRFRLFKSKEEAVTFSVSGLKITERNECYSPNLSKLSLLNEKLPHKSLTSQELIKLRKAIEKGDEILVLQEIWKNPRYLITDFDGPTIMQEGARYNALHVASRSLQTNVFAVILNVLQNHEFYETLYGSSSIPEERIHHIVDLYVNMPDKALSETPLHFAAKFGSYDIVRMLLNHPSVDKMRVNKCRLSASQIICTRSKDCSEQHINKIKKLFEDIQYVPVLHDKNSLKSIIGEPCVSEDMYEFKIVSPAADKPHFECCALAGPMSAALAWNLYTKWRKKELSEAVQFVHCSGDGNKISRVMKDISRSDCTKGFERIGRILADYLCTDWTELWPALGSWCSFNDPDDGFELLESHLKLRTQMLMLKIMLEGKNPEDFVTDENVFSPLTYPKTYIERNCELCITLLNYFVQEFIIFFTSSLTLQKINEKVSIYMLLQPMIPYMTCMSEISFHAEPELQLIHEELGHLIFLKLSQKIENCKHFIAYLQFQFSLRSVVPFQSLPTWQYILCILKHVCFFFWLNNGVTEIKSPSCMCSWKVTSSVKTIYSSSECYYSLVKSRQDLYNKIMCGKLNSGDAHTDILMRMPPENDKDFSNILEKVVEKLTFLQLSGNRKSPVLSDISSEITAFEESVFLHESFRCGLFEKLVKKISSPPYQNRKNPYEVYIANTSPSVNKIETLSSEREEYPYLSHIKYISQEMIRMPNFIRSTDHFSKSFVSVVTKYLYKMPFSHEASFFSIFSEVLPCLEDLCNLKFSKNVSKHLLHLDLANIVYFKLSSVLTAEDLEKLKNCILTQKCAISHISANDTTRTLEWVHLSCIFNCLCDLISKIDPNNKLCQENCTLNDLDNESNCLNALTCQSILKHMSEACEESFECEEIAISSSASSYESSEEFYTPPEKIDDSTNFQTPEADDSSTTFLDGFWEICVNRFEVAEEDIDIFRAIENISVPKKYSYVCSYKERIRERLEPFWNHDNVLTGTPLSSSAAVQRTLRKNIDDVRKTLFEDEI